MGTPHVHVHGNLVSHNYLAPLAIFLFFYYFIIFYLFFSGSLCVCRLDFLCPRWVGTINTSPLSPHTTMGSDTTCRANSTAGLKSMIVNKQKLNNKHTQRTQEFMWFVKLPTSTEMTGKFHYKK